jgi:hypothetical protein
VSSQARNDWIYASASNMAYMLSAQLSALQLNVTHGLIGRLQRFPQPWRTALAVRRTPR